MALKEDNPSYLAPDPFSMEFAPLPLKLDHVYPLLLDSSCS